MGSLFREPQSIFPMNQNTTRNLDNETIETALRLGELRAEVQEVLGAEVAALSLEGLPLPEQEALWRRVLAFEKAPAISIFEHLQQRCSYCPPEPSVLEKSGLWEESLWRLIRELAGMGVYFDCTNHLGDEELYRMIWEKVLGETLCPLSPESKLCNLYEMDEYGLPDEPDPAMVYLQYYADDEFRERIRREFPECRLPARRPCCSHRDAFLPTP